jgi:long-chain acyl-CoA synthetase
MWNLEKFGSKTAIVGDDDLIISYRDIVAQAKVIGKILTGRCLVFCLCGNTVGSLLGYYACLANKVVPVMLDSNQNEDYLAELAMIYQPEFVWLPVDLLVQFPMGTEIYTAHGYSLVKLPQIKKHEIADDLAVLLPTSGTTGSKKMVRLSYGNIEVNAISIIEYLEIDSDSRTISSLPMHYSYGLSIINTYLFSGGQIVLTKYSVLQKQFWDKLQTHGVTSLSGVPYTYELMQKLGFMDMDLPHLKVLCQAGGKLSDALNQKLAKYAIESGKRFYVMYGATEASPRISYLPHAFALQKCGSIGISIPGGNITLIDENGVQISAVGVPGELRYKGPNVALGYAESRSDLGRGDDWGGVLLTGDLAEFDKDGFFYIVGRKKRMIKYFGSRISLDDLEERFKARFPQDDFACIGNDSKVTVFSSNLSAYNGIVEILRVKLKFQKKNYQIVHVENIPKNSSGKTDYTGLKNLN